MVARTREHAHAKEAASLRIQALHRGRRERNALAARNVRGDSRRHADDDANDTAEQEEEDGGGGGGGGGQEEEPKIESLVGHGYFDEEGRNAVPDFCWLSFVFVFVFVSFVFSSLCLFVLLSFVFRLLSLCLLSFVFALAWAAWHTTIRPYSFPMGTHALPYPPPPPLPHLSLHSFHV